MRFFIGNICYLFTVSQGGGNGGGDAREGFHIEFHYRKSKESVIEEKRYFHVANDRRFSHEAESLMADLLQEFQVPQNITSDMSLHFKFHLFDSRLYRNGGSINVVVLLDVKEYTAERAAEIRRRMDAARIRRREVVDREAVAVVVQPANKKVVENLERKIVDVVNCGDDDDQCSICLGKIIVGEEVMKLPCLHIYHTNCIIQWLERTHYCPYCRFELPF